MLINVTPFQIWSVQEKKAETEVKADQNDGALPPQYLDVVVSSVKETSPFGFSVQMVNADSKLSAGGDHLMNTDENTDMPITVHRRFSPGKADERTCCSLQDC